MEKKYKKSPYGLEYDNKELTNANEILSGRIKVIGAERTDILRVLKKAIALVELIECSGKCKDCDKCDLFDDRVLKVWDIKR